MTPKPCTLASKHKWAWIKNVTTYRVGQRSATFALKGLYRCECGAQKTGPMNHNAQERNQ